MKITYLGQAGFLLETGDVKILIDPYLSNSVEKLQPQNCRRIPIDKRFLQIKPDIIVLTHNHLDHTDPETLQHYLTETSAITVLASKNAWGEVRKFGGFNNNYVMFNQGTVWTEKGVRFQAVKAEHSDEYAIGVIIRMEEKNYYFTGDTLYSENVFDSIPKVEYAMCFLPVNGRGNNMNFVESKCFVERVGAKYNVPIHFGMFDEINEMDISLTNKISLSVYQPYQID